jgi:hypothetical protein
VTRELQSAKEECYKDEADQMSEAQSLNSQCFLALWIQWFIRLNATGNHALNVRQTFHREDKLLLSSKHLSSSAGLHSDPHFLPLLDFDGTDL